MLVHVDLCGGSLLSTHGAVTNLARWMPQKRLVSTGRKADVHPTAPCPLLAAKPTSPSAVLPTSPTFAPAFISITLSLCSLVLQAFRVAWRYAAPLRSTKSRTFRL